MPHLLCTGFTREATEEALVELNYLGIHNVMALQGAPRVARRAFAPDRTENEHAIDRVADIGIEWAVGQAEELIARGAPCVHFHVLQSSREITSVLERLRKRI